MERIRPLENTIRSYAWGSRTALAALRGQGAPSAEPEAELWIGAHPVSPSRIRADEGWVPLDEWIARDPARVLGRSVAARFGAELPFLLKVLAVAEPLSLQAHPDLDQAREGFAREEQAGVRIDAPERCFRDPRHKPELVCALTPFTALKGFRDPREISRRLAALAPRSLEPELADFREQLDGEGWRNFFGSLLTLEAARRRLVVAEVVAAANRSVDSDPVLQNLIDLAKAHPDDIGILAPLFLNRVELEPGEALFLPARELHCYLEGVAIEVMANSDNVLRGGLTEKQVDVSALLAILDFGTGGSKKIVTRTLASREVAYPAPASEFELTSVVVEEGAPFSGANQGGVEILFCSEGSTSLGPLGEQAEVPLARGSAVFVPADVGGYRICGDGVVFRVRVPGAGSEPERAR